MSCLVSKQFRHLLLIFGSVVASSLAADPVSTGESGKPTAPAASQEGATSTNVTQLKTQQLREELLQEQLKKELSRSLNIFSSKGSLRGVAPPPIRPPAAPPARNKQIEQLLEGEKNRAFMTPDDLKEEKTLEEIFKLRHSKDGKDPREELSFLGRYLESLDRARTGGTNRSGGHLGSSRDEVFSAQDQATLPSAPLFQTENKLKDLFGASAGPTSSPGRDGGGIFFELFGVAELGQTGRTPAQKALLDEFKQLLETRSPLAVPMPAPGALGGPADPASALAAQSLQPRPTTEPLFGSINAGTGTRPGTLPDLNARSPTRSSLAPALPAESARSPATTLTFPKRKF